MFSLVSIAYAVDSIADDPIIVELKQQVIIPIIWLLFALALVLFLWGVVEFVWSGSEPTGRQKGRDHMIWGILGIGIMLSAFGIITLIYNTVTNDGKAKGILNKPYVPSVINRGSL